MRNVLWSQQRREDQPIARRMTRALEQSSSQTEVGALAERGEPDRWTLPFSPYTEARMHPLATTAVLAGIGLVVGAALHDWSSDK